MGRYFVLGFLLVLAVYVVPPMVQLINRLP